MRFTSSFTPDECAYKLKSAVEPEGFFVGYRRRSAVVGRVKRRRFYLRYQRPFLTNSFAPILYGRFEESAHGTEVHMHFRLHWLVIAFSTVWLAGVLYGGGVILFLSLRGLLRGEARVGEVPVWLGILAPLALLGFGVALVTWSWSVSGKTDKREILSLLRHVLHLRSEQHPH